ECFAYFWMFIFRGKPTSTVSISVSVLDLPGNDKSAKPLRRLSIPAKSSISPTPKLTGTPLSETRKNGSSKGQGSSSEKRVSMSRRKFILISSASYWLSQIKLSESAAKHLVSLGFFKLALESGCEPLQHMHNELKSYVRRHKLVEFGESLKELLISYDISEDIEQLQISETCSKLPVETTQLSEEGVHSSSSVNGGKKLKPKAFSQENVQDSSYVEPAKKANTQKISPSKNRVSAVSRKFTKSNTVRDIGGANRQKKSLRPAKQVAKMEKANTEIPEENFTGEKGPVESLLSGETDESLLSVETEHENKENKDAQMPEEISLIN
ncbi:hypothetical protein IFM89_036095, partial [Coptis chinensis]